MHTLLQFTGFIGDLRKMLDHSFLNMDTLPDIDHFAIRIVKVIDTRCFWQAVNKIKGNGCRKFGFLDTILMISDISVVPGLPVMILNTSLSQRIIKGAVPFVYIK
jgi:hypothetical protein